MRADKAVSGKSGMLPALFLQFACVVKPLAVNHST